MALSCFRATFLDCALVLFFLLLGRTALCDGPPWNKVSSFVCGVGLKADSIWHNCCVELRLAGAHVE